MIWHNHFELKDKHSFLSPSSYHWINYTPERLETVYRNRLAAEKGTELHELASRLINMGIKLPNKKVALNRFVNDAIDLNMRSEQPLYYSQNAFGTTDAIYFDNEILRIHDLKTGLIKAHMEQLKIYAAYFCLEYMINPANIFIELRIYQGRDVITCIPDVGEIVNIMDKVVESDTIIEGIRSEEAQLRDGSRE